ncbi:MAG: tetratricopeptide repeat protein [Candidatus Gorgyraea atricola]|nr:tetratricopeptide repeat protein [Candidatus Gorgyraea atricola]
MRRIILFFICISFIFCSSILAQSPDDVYRRANLSYEDEEYEEAISLYETLIQMDKISPEVFYNLANSFFKLKKIGKAIVNYERALRLAPRDKDALLNLKLARSMAVDKIEIPKKGFLLDLILFPYNRLTVNELTVFVSAFYLLILLFLIFSIFFVEKRTMIFYNVGTFTFLLIIFSIFLISKIHNENFAREAIVISEKVSVRSGPKEDYLLQFTLHEGTKVRVVEERQLWYEIDLSKDLRGWLPKDSVEII